MKNYLAFALLFATVAAPALMSARAHAAVTGVSGVQVAEAGQGAAGAAQSAGAQGQDEGSDMDDEGDDQGSSGAPDKGGSAQGDGGGSSGGSDNGGSNGGGSQRFQAMKAKVLQGLDNRIAKVQAMQSCVQSATDRQSLRACLPARGSRGGQSGGGDSGN